jgi:hypothetical protein
MYRSSFVLSSNVPVVRGIKKSKVLEEALRVRTIFSNNSKLLIKNRITVNEAKSISSSECARLTEVISVAFADEIGAVEI